MPDAIDLRSLLHTPLRDLARTRVTGRLDYRRTIARAALPPSVTDSIFRIVRRSRLWRSEKATIADELIAHFADGLASGAGVDELVRDFGDERSAARLIRRATIRKRPLAWHAMRWTRRALLVVVAFYAAVFARFFLARPTVSVDYVARLNAPLANVPIEQRAWPLYRKAMLALDVNDLRRGTSPQRPDWTHPLFAPIDAGDDAADRQIVDATPADADAWRTLTAWLDGHADGLATLHAATTRPTLGFVLGPAGSERDPELGWNFNNDATPSADSPLVSVLLPTLSHMRQLARLLDADARVAAVRGDGTRVVDDLVVMLGVARHQSDPIVVSRLVGIGIDALAFDAIERLLRDRASTLSDAQLVALAHRVANVGGDAPRSLVDLSAERMLFANVVQRLYSDDGHGDGVLTPGAARTLRLYAAGTYDPRHAGDDVATTLAIVGAGPILSTRRAVVEEHDRLMSLLESRFARPLRETTKADNPARRFDARLAEIRASPLLMARYLIVYLLTPRVDRAAWTAERLLGKREGVTVGLALELYRRRHGDWPATLDALVPDLLPRVPADRITGGPIRYRLVDGKPVVYSVGVDRDDDGGRAYADKRGGTRPDAAAEWPIDSSATPKDGDWILFDGRAAK